MTKWQTIGASFTAEETKAIDTLINKLNKGRTKHLTKNSFVRACVLKCLQHYERKGAETQ